MERTAKPGWVSRNPVLAILLAVLCTLGVVFGAYKFVTSKPPVVQETDGDNMPEVATVIHRKAYSSPESDGTILGVRIPGCKSRRQVSVKAAITYRIPLAEEWEAEVRSGRFFVVAPQLQPSLPVAFDTGSIKKFAQDCMIIDGEKKYDDLLGQVSQQLAISANSEQYKQIARPYARKTVKEFVRKWMATQDEFKVRSNMPIDVVFEGEPARELE
jgi:hypothetical protein